MELEQTKIHTLWGDKMNNKGSTLLELIISIALISVILVFMVRLLVDLNDSETNNKYAKKNQVIRAEILRTIENDLQNKIITDIRDNSTTSNLIITFKFNDNKESNINVLKDISFDVNDRDIVAIVGPSGSGKSTLLRCLNLIEVPTSGDIVFEGKSLLDKKTNLS